MAQLNDYIAADGTNLGIPNKPVNRYSPNALARVTPKYSRGDASDAYDVWVMGYIGTGEETRFSGIKGGDASWTGGTYLLFSDGATDGYIWFTFDGAGADPAPNGNPLAQIDVYSGDSAADVTHKLIRAFRKLANTEILMEGSNSINVRNTTRAVTTDATAGTLTDNVITVAVLVQGVAPDTTAWDGTFTDTIDGPQNLQYADE